MKILREALVRAGRVAVLVYCGLVVLGCVAANKMIFQPQPASYGGGLPGLLMAAAADDTPLAVLHLPNPAARHTVFYFHGNAEDLGDTLPLLQQLHAAGFAVLSFDYRGYGRSAGKPSEENVYADTQAVLAFARARLGIASEQMIAVGRSVGSGAAVELAVRSPLAGLVLISPLASAVRVMTRVKLLPFDRFDNLAKASRVRCPSLVLHGTADEVIAFVHGRNLFEKLPAPKRNVWIERAGHNDIFAIAGDRILGEIAAFGQNLPASTVAR